MTLPTPSNLVRRALTPPPGIDEASMIARPRTSNRTSRVWTTVAVQPVTPLLPKCLMVARARPLASAGR
jgi:hypothetical protein